MWLKLMLIAGGVFNFAMGMIFFHQDLLALFLDVAEDLEAALFQLPAYLAYPTDPVHIMFIHGFGAAAMILGTTLLYCARHPYEYRHFILFDGVGRIGYGAVMVFFTFRYQLARTILLFAAPEILFGCFYVAGFLKVKKKGMS